MLSSNPGPSVLWTFKLAPISRRLTSLGCKSLRPLRLGAFALEPRQLSDSNPHARYNHGAPKLPLVSLDRISVAFGHLPLLDGASMQIESRERVAILGRNGSGKSTLLRIVSGEQPPDEGSVWTAPGVRIARLEQDVPFSTDRTVFEVVAEGVGGHHESWQVEQLVNMVLSRMNLPPGVAVDTLSGGWK